MRKNLSKKTLSAFLAIVMTLATMAGMFTFSAGAAQTEDSSAKLTADTSWHTADTAGLEFTLTEPSDFLGFISLIRSGKTFEGQTVKLGNDIDLNQGWNADSYVDGTGVTWSTSGSSANKPINIINYNNKFFAGTFDGQGYAISGIYYKTANTSGLFGQINTGAIAEIKNLTIENSFFGDVNKNNHCALIGGMSGTAVFSNIHIKENVYMATNMGNGAFFVGLNKGTVTISNSIVEGTIITYDHTTARDSLTFGGFLGYANADTIATFINCVFAGDLLNKCSTTAPTITTNYIVASNTQSRANVTNCYYVPIDGYGTSDISYGEGSVKNLNTMSNPTYTITGIAAQTLLNSMTSNTYNMNAWVATTTGTPELRADVTASAAAAPKGAKISDGATTDFGWYGFQYGTGENSDSLRLLGTVKEDALSKYDSIGFKAVAYFVDAAGNKVQTNSVTYTTVYESVAADGTPITEDGSYFFAQTVKGIPQNAGDVIFEITTYAMQGSTEIIGNTYRIVYCL